MLFVTNNSYYLLCNNSKLLLRIVTSCNECVGRVVVNCIQLNVTMLPSHYCVLYTQISDIQCLQLLFLSQVDASLKPGCTWFLKIVFVQTSVCVCVCVCVCVRARTRVCVSALKTSGVIWTSYV